MQRVVLRHSSVYLHVLSFPVYYRYTNTVHIIECVEVCWCPAVHLARCHLSVYLVRCAIISNTA